MPVKKKQVLGLLPCLCAFACAGRAPGGGGGGGLPLGPALSASFSILRIKQTTTHIKSRPCLRCSPNEFTYTATTLAYTDVGNALAFN